MVLMLHTIYQPYTKRIHNIVDMLLFVNLLLINSLSSFNYHKITSCNVKLRDIRAAAIVQQILIYIPVILFATYMIVGYIFFQRKHAPGLIILKVVKKLKQSMRSVSSRNENSSSNDEDELFRDRFMDEEVDCHDYHRLEDINRHNI